MKQYSRILIVLCFLGIGFVAYAGASAGWGSSPFKDHSTMAEIKQNCPDGYKNREGDCLKTTFRSIWFLRGSSSRSGGSGSGK